MLNATGLTLSALGPIGVFLAVIGVLSRMADAAPLFLAGRIGVVSMVEVCFDFTKEAGAVDFDTEEEETWPITDLIGLDCISGWMQEYTTSRKKGLSGTIGRSGRSGSKFDQSLPYTQVNT
jgi:hypothetical protein